MSRTPELDKIERLMVGHISREMWSDTRPLILGILDEDSLRRHGINMEQLEAEILKNRT